MARRASALRRRGFMLVSVASLLAVLGALYLVQSRLASAVTADAEALLRGEAARLLADAALNEAMAQVRWQAGDPGSVLGARLREAVYAPADGALDLGDCVELREAHSLLEPEQARGLVVGRPEVRVVWQRQLDATPYERAGLIRYRVEARSARLFARTLVRSVEAVQAFKVVLTSAPRPYGSFGICVLNPDGLVEPARVNQGRGAVIEAHGALWAAVRAARAAAPAALSVEYDVLEDALVPEAQAAERTADLTCPEDGALVGLVRHGVTFDLAQLDRAEAVREAVAGLPEAAEELLVAGRRLGAAPSDEAAHREFIAAARAAGDRTHEGLLRLWAFGEAFRVVDRRSQDFAALRHGSYKFERAAWERRAQFVVEPRQGEPDVQAAWRRFRAEHPVLRGVVVVRNEDRPLRLEGALPGQVALVVGAGGVELHDLNAGDDDEGLVTVVACEGEVRVSGSVCCALFLGRTDAGGGPRLAIAPDATLRGSLTAWARPAGRLQGSLIRDGRFSSGVTTPEGGDLLDPSHLWVALQPPDVYRKAARS